MTPDEFFRGEMERLSAVFAAGDYTAFLEALTLCVWNERPLPGWIADIVMRQAEEAFAASSTGPGRQGNWRAKLLAKRIDDQRADLARFHLRARRRKGRVHVSDLGRLYGYGTQVPEYGGVNIVTRDDIFKFISSQLRGTPAQGTPNAIEDSYKRVNRRRKAGAE